MFRLDYISCALTVLSTVLIGRRVWQGWIVAGTNSVIICVIGVKTAQLGFVPANLFCLALYGYNLVKWRSDGKSSASDEIAPTVAMPVPQPIALSQRRSRHRASARLATRAMRAVSMRRS